jgi:hypothetical protein
LSDYEVVAYQKTEKAGAKSKKSSKFPNLQAYTLRDEGTPEYFKACWVAKGFLQAKFMQMQTGLVIHTTYFVLLCGPGQWPSKG